MSSEDMIGALDEQGSEIDIARLGDAELRISLTGLAAPRSESEIATNVPTSLERSLLPSVRTYVSAVRWPTP